jgi:hypothetical protein
VTKGDLHDLPADEFERASFPVLFEHPSERSCLGDSVVTLQDVGATFGGAGQFTGRGAKIHLKSWAEKDIFASSSRATHGGASECRGNIDISGSAGADAGENPRISEAGRQFLTAQFHRLTPESVRAIFEVARVDDIGEVQEWQDGSKKTHTGVDAWAAVFMDKVSQIEGRHCGGSSGTAQSDGPSAARVARTAQP